MSPSLLGVTRTITHTVDECELVTRLFPAVAVFADKPHVMATATLGALCEWPPMEALRHHIGAHQDGLGTELSVLHLRAILPGDELEVTAMCTHEDGRATWWSVAVRRESEVVATAKAAFVVVDCARFTAKHTAPAGR